MIPVFSLFLMPSLSLNTRVLFPSLISESTWYIIQEQWMFKLKILCYFIKNPFLHQNWKYFPNLLQYDKTKFFFLEFDAHFVIFKLQFHWKCEYSKAKFVAQLSNNVFKINFNPSVLLRFELRLGNRIFWMFSNKNVNQFKDFFKKV